MTDEEKKAIVELNHYCNLTQYWKNVEYTKPEFDNYITTILNLIEKQQKEIEELRENKGYHLGFVDGGIAKRYEMEDKIKAKIEEVKDGTFDAKIVLQLLLEKE